MAGDAHFASVNRMFSAQFTPSGEDYIYRRSSKGEAIRVTAAERDDFVARFDRVMRRSSWIIIAATILLILLLAFLTPGGADERGQLLMTIGIGGIVAIHLGVYHRAWNRPVRVLARRAVIGEALTREEARGVVLARISYGQLAIAALMGVVMAWNHATRSDGLRGWARLWLVLAGALIVTAAVQAVRKWHHDRSG